MSTSCSLQQYRSKIILSVRSVIGSYCCFLHNESLYMLIILNVFLSLRIYTISDSYMYRNYSILILTQCLLPRTEIVWVRWLLYNTQWSLSVGNIMARKVLLDEMKIMMITVLYVTNRLSWMYIVLTHWHNSPCMYMLPHWHNCPCMYMSPHWYNTPCMYMSPHWHNSSCMYMSPHWHNSPCMYMSPHGHNSSCMYMSHRPDSD